MRKPLWIGVLVIVALMVALNLEFNQVEDRPISKTSLHAQMKRPVVKLTEEYAGSDSCRKCHARSHATWHASYHRTMTQVPDADNVVADFHDVSLDLHGQSYILSNTGDDYWVELNAPDWNSTTVRPPRVKRQITLMTGSHHEQDFWFETPHGRTIQRLPFVYRIEEQEWYPDTSVLMTPPEAPSGFGNWNVVCIQCHTTLGRPHVTPFSPVAKTEVVEFGISCEACHGPGAAHVERYQTRADHPEVAADWKSRDQIINPGQLDHRRSSEVCGQCHSISLLSDEDSVRWASHGFRFRPGQKLDDTRIVVQPGITDEDPTLQQLIQDEPNYMDDRFWSDGMVRVVGREYTGLIASPCFQRGTMSCLSCHELHPAENDPRPLEEWADDQLRFDRNSDRACLQCHTEMEEQLVAHTHHAADSEGSRCYNCHMPPTTYGLLKAVRSHQIDSPSLAPTLKAGRPNACNLCHLDKTMSWVNEALVDWYGQEQQVLTSAQSNIPASVLWTLQGDAGQRALIAWAMAWAPAQTAAGTDWQARILAPLLDDPYDVVRFIVGRSLRSLPGFDEFEYDFLAAPEVRQGVSQQTIEVWESQRKQSGLPVDLSDLLQTDSADSLSEFLETLLRKRDDRRVELAE